MEVVAGGPDDLLTVRYVRSAGSDAEIGWSLAAAAHEAHGDLVLPLRIDPEIQRVRRRWFERNDPARARRSLGVAEYFDVDQTDATVVLDMMTTYGRPPQCSVAYYPGRGTSNGHALLARNMDFPTRSSSELLGREAESGERAVVADTWIVEMHPDRGHASITVGFGDALGSMDGVNDAGLAVALLAASVRPSMEPTNRPEVGLSEAQVVQYLLSSCATIDDAMDAMRLAKHYYLAMPCHYVVADRSGGCFVWEHSQHHNREIVVKPELVGDGRVVCTNHLLHRVPDATGLSDDNSSVATATQSYQRWRTLTRLMTAHRVVDAAQVGEDLASVRFDRPDEETKTIWHAIYDLHDTTVELSFLLESLGSTHRYSEPLTFSLRDEIGGQRWS